MALISDCSLTLLHASAVKVQSHLHHQSPMDNVGCNYEGGGVSEVGVCGAFLPLLCGLPRMAN